MTTQTSASPTVACDMCAAGPQGIVGHHQLFLFRVDAQRMQFKCQGCGTLWTRTDESHHAFKWLSSEIELKGWSVPRSRAREAHR